MSDELDELDDTDADDVDAEVAIREAIVTAHAKGRESALTQLYAAIGRQVAGQYFPSLSGLGKAFDSSEKRDESGKWSTSGGGGQKQSEASSSAKSGSSTPKPTLARPPESREEAEAIGYALRDLVVGSDDDACATTGQCIDATSMLRHLGPDVEIWRGIYPGDWEEGGEHRINKIGDWYIDVTADQFDGQDVVVFSQDDFDEAELGQGKFWKYGGFEHYPTAEETTDHLHQKGKNDGSSAKAILREMANYEHTDEMIGNAVTKAVESLPNRTVAKYSKSESAPNPLQALLLATLDHRISALESGTPDFAARVVLQSLWDDPDALRAITSPLSVRVVKGFDSGEKRDESGKWSASGSSGGAKSPIGSGEYSSQKIDVPDSEGDDAFDVRVWKNPPADHIAVKAKNLPSSQPIRGVLDGNDLYVWWDQDVHHQPTANALDLKSPVGFENRLFISYDRDSERVNVETHSPSEAVAEWAKSNGFLYHGEDLNESPEDESDDDEPQHIKAWSPSRFLSSPHGVGATGEDGASFTKGFDESEKRDASGKWSESGGGGDSASKDTPKLTQRTPNSFTGTFSHGGVDYAVHAHRGSDEVEEMGDRAPYSIEFDTKAGDRPSDDGKLTGVAGHSAIGAMRTVGAAISDWLATRKPLKVAFLASADEPSRVRLYARLADALAKQHGYTVHRQDGAANTRFLLVRNPSAPVQKAWDASELDDEYAEFVKAWSEELHPRNKRGIWISRERIHEAKTDPKLAAELREEVKPADAQKLDDALAGKSDTGRTVRGVKKDATTAKRTKQTATRSEAKRLATRLMLNQHAPDVQDLRDLAHHLQSGDLRAEELRDIRLKLGAKFGGGRKMDQMVNALKSHVAAEVNNLKPREPDAHELSRQGFIDSVSDKINPKHRSPALMASIARDAGQMHEDRTRAAHANGLMGKGTEDYADLARPTTAPVAESLPDESPAVPSSPSRTPEPASESLPPPTPQPRRLRGPSDYAPPSDEEFAAASQPTPKASGVASESLPLPADSTGTAKLADGRTVSFVPHPSADHGGRTTVMVDPAKLDAELAKDTSHHVPAGGGPNEIGGRRDNFKKFLESGKPIEQPEVSVHKGKIRLNDGRHRFSVLHEAGIDQIPVTVHAGKAAEELQKWVGVTPDSSSPHGPAAAAGAANAIKDALASGTLKSEVGLRGVVDSHLGVEQTDRPTLDAVAKQLGHDDWNHLLGQKSGANFRDWQKDTQRERKQVKPASESLPTDSGKSGLDKPPLVGDTAPVPPNGGGSTSGGSKMEPWQMTREQFKKELHMPFDGVHNSSEGGVNYVATPETRVADDVLEHLRAGGDKGDIDAMVSEVSADQNFSAAHNRAIVGAINHAVDHFERTKGSARKDTSKLDGEFKSRLNDLFPVANRGTLDKHKAAVSTALKSGKPVPPEVLADYSDLSPTPASESLPVATPTAPTSGADASGGKTMQPLTGKQRERAKSRIAELETAIAGHESALANGMATGIHAKDTKAKLRTAKNQRDNWKAKLAGESEPAEPAATASAVPESLPPLTEPKAAPASPPAALSPDALASDPGADRRTLAKSARDSHAKLLAESKPMYDKFNRMEDGPERDRLGKQLDALEPQIKTSKAKLDSVHNALAVQNGHDYGVHVTDATGGNPEVVAKYPTLSDAAAHAKGLADSGQLGGPVTLQQGRDIDNEYGEKGGYWHSHAANGRQSYVAKVPRQPVLPNVGGAGQDYVAVKGKVGPVAAAKAKTDFNPDSAIKIAADDITKLRKPDVFRVLDWAPTEHRDSLASHIIKNRPDLKAEVDDVLSELKNPA